MHWIRENAAPSTLPAIARASTVFAVPGTSSSSTWPPQTSAVRTSRISSVLPRTTVSTLASSRVAISGAELTGPIRLHQSSWQSLEVNSRVFFAPATDA